MQQNKSLGHINAMKLNLTAPMKVDFNLEMRSLNLLAGMNGTGKSVILKLNWLLSTVMNNMIAAKKWGVGIDSGDNKQHVQFYFDNTFTDNNFDGTIEALFNDATIKVQLELGVVKSCEGTFAEALQPTSQPIFMSTVTRLITEHIKYLQLKKNNGRSNWLSKRGKGY